jgi:bile acid:Na+ symporter, BASS family
MNIGSLIGFGFTVSIFLGVIAVGMRVAPEDLPYVLSKPARLVRSLLAMNVLAPITAVIVCKMFSLHPAVIVALVTLSIAPVGSLFSQAMLPLVAPDHRAYARGLLFASALLSVILTPLAVEVIQLIFGGEVHVNPLAVTEVVVASVLLPLGIGLVIGRWWPGARRWIPAIQKVSSLLLLVCAVILIAGAWSLMASVVRLWTTTAILLIALIWLVIGHVLGGPDEDDRTVLAFATVSRHPGVAMVVASLADQPLAPIGVLVTVFLCEVAVVPYKFWRKRLHAAAPGAAGQGSPRAGAH